MRNFGLGWIIQIATLAALSGCYTEALGESCKAESECETGLRCFQPVGGDQGVCTVGCSEGDCEIGVCIDTRDGKVCAADCNVTNDCTGDLLCQEATDLSTACWVRDPNLRPLATESSGLPCETSDECASGFVCGTSGLCAASCDSGACAQGQCTVTDSGALCLTGCDASLSCDLGLECQLTGGRERVCWTNDSHLTPIPRAPLVGKVVLRADSNQDGRLNPSETACLEVYAWNASSTTVSNIRTSIKSVNPFVQITEGRTSAQGSSRCGSGWNPTLAPGETSSSPVLNTRIQLLGTAPLGTVNFQVDFVDALGNTWSDDFTLEVVSSRSEVAIARVELSADSNVDGRLNPSENACLAIFATNSGSSHANSVASAIRTSNPFVQITEGRTSAQGSSRCGSGWNPTLAPGETSSSPVLNTRIQLLGTAPLGPVNFQVDFVDALGNTWTDDFALEVVSSRSEVAIARVELSADSNLDGRLNPSEAACLAIFAINSGSSQANSVASAVRTSNPFVQITEGRTSAQGSSRCGSGWNPTLAPGETSSSPVLNTRIQLLGTAPLGTMNFQVDFVDALGNTWSDDFTLDVVSSRSEVAIARVELSADSNVDGRLNPNETACLAIFATNFGSSQANSVTSAVRTSSPFVQITEGRTSAQGSSRCGSGWNPTLAPGETSSSPVLNTRIQLLGTAPTGPVNLQVDFADSLGNTWTDSFTLTVVP
jgi:hypothetical protein